VPLYHRRRSSAPFDHAQSNGPTLDITILTVHAEPSRSTIIPLPQCNEAGEWGRVSPEIASATYDSSLKAVTQDGSIPDEGLRVVIDQARSELKISREIQPGEVAEFALLNQAQKELGLK